MNQCAKHESEGPMKINAFFYFLAIPAACIALNHPPPEDRAAGPGPCHRIFPSQDTPWSIWARPMQTCLFFLLWRPTDSVITAATTLVQPRLLGFSAVSPSCPTALLVADDPCPRPWSDAQSPKARWNQVTRRVLSDGMVLNKL